MATGTPDAKARDQQLLLSATLCRRWLRALVLALAMLIPLPGRSAEPVSKEYQLKAAFLYNFTKFVDWPTNRLTNKGEPIVIGVLGNNPFGDELAKAVAGRTQNGHPFLVTNLTAVTEAKIVHLLFVPRGQEAALDAVMSETGLLTVGESEPFAHLGGIITFTMEAEKIRFEINLDAVEKSGLKISSKLLQLAKIVRSKPHPGPP